MYSILCVAFLFLSDRILSASYSCLDIHVVVVVVAVVIVVRFDLRQTLSNCIKILPLLPPFFVCQCSADYISHITVLYLDSTVQ